MDLEILTIPVLSYCDIPENITENNSVLSEASCDVYIKVSITSKEEQKKYSDDFELENWVIDKYPDLEGKDVLIHIDY